MSIRSIRSGEDLGKEEIVLAVRKKDGLRKLLILTVVVALLFLALHFWAGDRLYDAFSRAFFGPSVDETALVQQNEALRNELKKLRLDYDVEVSTRQSLERQIAVSQEQLKKVTTELEFLKSANGE